MDKRSAFSLSGALFLVSTLAALPASAQPASGASTISQSFNVLTCDEWGPTTTTDASVDLSVLQTSATPYAITLVFDANGNLALTDEPQMRDVFKDDVYLATAADDVQTRTSNIGSAIHHRRITGELVDIMTYSGLDGAAPQLVWQRLRLDHDAPMETMAFIGCRRS